MLKLLGTAAAAVLLVSSPASFGQTSSQAASAAAAESSSVGEMGNTYSTIGVASTQARRDWWTDLGLTAADVGEAALPWTTRPRLEDESSP
jgi:hypothetical protein